MTAVANNQERKRNVLLVILKVLAVWLAVGTVVGVLVGRILKWSGDEAARNRHRNGRGSDGAQRWYGPGSDRDRGHLSAVPEPQRVHPSEIRLRVRAGVRGSGADRQLPSEGRSGRRTSVERGDMGLRLEMHRAATDDHDRTEHHHHNRTLDDDYDGAPDHYHRHGTWGDVDFEYGHYHRPAEHHHHGPDNDDILVHDHDGGDVDHIHVIDYEFYKLNHYGPADHDHDGDDEHVAEDRH